MEWDPSIPYVDSAKMGTTIDIANPRQLPEAESGASIVLHGEWIEWSDDAELILGLYRAFALERYHRARRAKPNPRSSIDTP